MSGTCEYQVTNGIGFRCFFPDVFNTGVKTMNEINFQELSNVSFEHNKLNPYLLLTSSSYT